MPAIRRPRRSGRNTSGGGLTGGSGDVNPQFLSATALQSGADATTTATIALPIDRLRFGSNRVGAVEVLSATFDPRVITVGAVASILGVAITTKSFGTTKVQFNEPTIVAYFHVAAATAGFGGLQFPYKMDLTDAAGHGVMVCTDQIFAQCFSTTTSLTNQVDIKLEYRYKNITLHEYVGVVQSQS